MAANSIVRKQKLGEEIANSISHAVGAILGIIGMILLILKSETILGVVCAAIYGGSLIVLYAISSAYHAIPWEKTKKVLRVFDHCSIYLLILGSYVPVALLVVGGKIGWMLCVVNGMCALIGIILNCFNITRFEKLSLALYVIMGWMVVLAIKPLIAAMPSMGIMGLVLGGVIYTIGIVFYKAKHIKYMHFVWHLFVLAGSVVHYLVIYYYCYVI